MGANTWCSGKGLGEKCNGMGLNSGAATFYKKVPKVKFVTGSSLLGPQIAANIIV